MTLVAVWFAYTWTKVSCGRKVGRATLSMTSRLPLTYHPDFAVHPTQLSLRPHLLFWAANEHVQILDDQSLRRQGVRMTGQSRDSGRSVGFSACITWDWQRLLQCSTCQSRRESSSRILRDIAQTAASIPLLVGDTLVSTTMLSSPSFRASPRFI